MAEEKDLGFKISDHRKFNPDGTLRDNSSEDSAETQSSPEAPAPDQDASRQAGDANKVLPFPVDKRDERPDSMPDSTGGRQPAAGPAATASPFFDELINMLTVEAVMHLGLIENPGGGEVTIDLEAARHMIDLLGMLQNKTKGNLTPDESLLIDNVLADLRMQFVAISRAT
ncbi:MAG TPA: DUF1844 domain-containing protein [Blastocatellia bacterium]